MQTTQPHRDHVRQAQGLAARGNTIRQMPQGLPLSNRPCRNRHFLVMSPEPSHVYQLQLDRHTLDQLLQLIMSIIQIDSIAFGEMWIADQAGED